MRKHSFSIAIVCVMVLFAAVFACNPKLGEAEPTLNYPAGVTEVVTTNGCASATVCPYGHAPANYYYSPLRRVVLYVNQTPWTRMHEYCHAHQHEAVRWYLGVEPGIALDEWYQTPEYALWAYYADWSPMPWRVMSAWSPLEDFATSCGLYFTDPHALWTVSPERWYAMGLIFGFW